MNCLLNTFTLRFFLNKKTWFNCYPLSMARVLSEYILRHSCSAISGTLADRRQLLFCPCTGKDNNAMNEAGNSFDTENMLRTPIDPNSIL